MRIERGHNKVRVFSVTSDSSEEKLEIEQSTILLVDDEEYNLDILEQLLSI